MKSASVGFIGGGRVTRLMLRGFKCGGAEFGEVIVSDISKANLDLLTGEHPGVITSINDNAKPAGADIVFIAVHPPAMTEALATVAGHLRPGAVVVSLAPKFRIGKLSSLLGSHAKIVRMIPNAPSIVNAGYNPVAFSAGICEEQKNELKNLFSRLGECPEVDERKLEAYAMISAMGPTYLWFQLCHLQTLAQSFGFSHAEARDAVAAMLRGAERTMFASGLGPEEVIDLIPSKPLKDDESAIKDIYTARLTALYEKLIN